MNYSRAEAGRILLAATGRQGISAEDRASIVRFVAADTGAAPPDAERRVGVAITAATTAVHKARRSAVILGFCAAVSLLLGAAAARYAASPSRRGCPDLEPAMVEGLPVQPRQRCTGSEVSITGPF